MIINHFNVWQPPVAKHWSITVCLLTTTTPPLSLAAAAVRERPHGLNEARLSPPTTPRHRHNRARHQLPRHIPRPPPTSSTSPKYHVTTVDKPRTTRHRRRQTPNSPEQHVTAIDEPRTTRHRRRRAPSDTSPPLPALQTPRHHRARSQTTPPHHYGCPSPPRGMWAPKSASRE